MQFFKKKTEQNSGLPRRSVSQNSLQHDPARSQVNGVVLSENDKVLPRNVPLGNQGSAKMTYIYIDSSDPDLEELSHGFTGTRRPRRESQLSKTLKQVLHDRDALPHFIQFMDSVGSSNLVKFWLDADTFRSTSLSRMNFESSSDATHPKQSLSEPAASLASDENALTEKLEKVALDHLNSTGSDPPASKKSQHHHLGSVTAHGHGQSSQNLPPSSPTSVPRIACESASLASTRKSGTMGCPDNIQGKHPQNSGDVRSNCQDSDSGAVELPENSSVHLSEGSPGGTTLPVDNSAGPLLPSSHISSVSAASMERDVQETEPDSFQGISKSVENDAIVIFSKYLSPDCQNPIGISDRLRDQTIGQICHADGRVDPHCFDRCQQYVFDLMETRYYSQFIQSVYYVKHQIDILSQLLLVDILYNDTALSYFTEFMEEQKAMVLLQCFLDLDNFQHHLLSQGINYDANEAQNDAMIIYDKYISMQATQPVRFNDKVRLKVESDICREAGLMPDCFHLPCQLVLRHVEKTHFPLFLKSEMYTKYVTDLLNTSHLMQDSVEYRRKRAGSDTSSEKSAGNLSTGNDSSSKNTYLARDTSGQHFAKAMNRFSDNMRIDSSLFNPDNLWHRPNAGRMKFGKVTELGRFVSDFDPDPDHDKKKLAQFFTASKKREREKSEEDMAWHVAQQIISTVMTETSNDSSPLDSATSEDS